MIDKNLMSKILEFEENFEKKLELDNIEHIYDYCILVYYISLIPELTENEKKSYLQKGRYFLKIFLKNIKKYPNYTGSWYGITGILYIMHALSINNDLDDKIKYLERIVIDSTRQNFLIQKPANGPMIIAAISIVIEVSLIMAPITAIAPTTRPLSPPTIFPPVDAIRIGIR